MSSQKRVLQQPEASSSSGTTSIQDTGPPKKQKQASTFEDFPVDVENPFKTDCYGSDITLIVEGKKLHTHRMLLSLYSSYFRVLLVSGNFAEAGAKEIELKGSEVKYDAMVKFLLQLYPVHSHKSINGDQMLMDLFPLAGYFQCQHVRTKCESYIRQKISNASNYSHCSVESAFLYLYLCEKYQVETFTEDLLSKVSSETLKGIQADEHFRVLSPEMQRDVFQRRAEYVEEMASKQRKATQEFLSGSSVFKKTCQKCQKETEEGHFICSVCACQFKQGFLRLA